MIIRIQKTPQGLQPYHVRHAMNGVVVPVKEVEGTVRHKVYVVETAALARAVRCNDESAADWLLSQFNPLKETRISSRYCEEVSP